LQSKTRPDTNFSGDLKHFFEDAFQLVEEIEQLRHVTLRTDVVVSLVLIRDVGLVYLK
jgi:hypothetical protein